MSSLRKSDLIDLARIDLLAYTMLVSPWYNPSAWHHLLADVLMQFLREAMAGLSPRYIINAPVRHGKSELTSKHFPAWAMSLYPGNDFIFTTYAQELANDNGRKVRNLMQSSAHQEIFPLVRLAPDSQAVGHFVVQSREPGSKESEYFSVGVGGALTGRGGRIIVVDDPIKNREEADSAVIRRKTKSMYDDDLKTRSNDGGGILIMNTRWHEDDLTNYVLTQYADEDWHVLNLPAICESVDDPVGRKIGEALYPEKYNVALLEKIRGNSPPRTWAALYQQRPQADTGIYFEVDKLKSYSQRPVNLVIIGATDAATTTDGGDFTEHGIFGMDHLGELYLLDWWSGQQSSDVWIGSQIDLMIKWRPAIWFDEAGVINKATAPFRNKAMQKRGVGCRMETLPSLIGKEGRAEGFRGMMSMGWVHFPKTAWAARLTDQLRSFPAGAFDDAVDVCSLVARGVSQFGNAIKPKDKKPVYQLPRPNTVRVVDMEREEPKAVSRFKR